MKRDTLLQSFSKETVRGCFCAAFMDFEITQNRFEKKKECQAITIAD